MNASTFRLNSQIGGIGYYAEVTVEILSNSDDRKAILSPQVFAWLKDEYGPDAWEWPVCEDYREGALAGCVYALDHQIAQEPVESSIHIVTIKGHPAHSTWQSVAYAACYAVWDAIGDAGTRHPQVTSEGITQLLRHPNSEQGAAG